MPSPSAVKVMACGIRGGRVQRAAMLFGLGVGGVQVRSRMSLYQDPAATRNCWARPGHDNINIQWDI